MTEPRPKRTVATLHASASPVSDELYLRIQRFLFQEARMLDRRQYEAWLGLWTETLSYKVVVPTIRDSAATPIEYEIVDEDRTGLASRINQIRSPGLTRAENPPSLVRRLISNIEAFNGPEPDTIAVESYFAVQKIRGSLLEGDLYFGERLDSIVQTEQGLKLARRTVRLTQAVLVHGTLSTIL